MKRFLIALLAASAALTSSCMEENPIEPQTQGEYLELTANIEPSTRTALNNDFSVRWNSTDAISLSGGTSSAKFAIKSMAPDGSTARFAGTIPTSDRYQALYPYQEKLTWANGTVTADLPAVQNAVEGTFADGASLAVAEVLHNEMAFKNVGAILAFTIQNEGIRNIRLSSNDGTPLAGTAKITVSNDPTVEVTGGTGTIDLKGNFAKGKTYYMTVLPGTHAKGFHLTFYTADGKTAELNATKPLTLERNGNILLFDLPVPAAKWTEHYILVKDAAKLQAGDIVRIGASTRNIGAGALTAKDGLEGVAATFANGEMNSADAQDFTLGKGTKGWRLTSAQGDLGVSSKTSLTYGGGSKDWTITIDAQGNAEISATSGRLLLYSSSAKLFKNYSGTNKNKPSYALAQLYRKATSMEDLGDFSGTNPDPTPTPGPDPDPNPDPNPGPDPTPDPTPGDGQPANGQTHWLEMPGTQLVGEPGMYCVTHHASMNGKSQRNYTLLYDSDMLTSYWVAYPLCSSHMGSGRKENWAFDPKIPQDKQTSVKSGYKLPISTPNYPNNSYARGHQIPNADRSAVAGMMAQTYYSTNMTPQIQNGFNGMIWARLEEAARSAVVSDTLYIVTGATFNKVGENQPVKKVKNGNDGKMMPVPNYYWKVMLKVKRGGPGNITSAKAAAFWLPHEDLKDHVFTEYETTVDQIEAWTGFDFFVNLPAELQQAAEAQKDWSGFLNW